MNTVHVSANLELQHELLAVYSSSKFYYCVSIKQGHFVIASRHKEDARQIQPALTYSRFTEKIQYQSSYCQGLGLPI